MAKRRSEQEEKQQKVESEQEEKNHWITIAENK